MGWFINKAERAARKKRKEEQKKAEYEAYKKQHPPIEDLIASLTPEDKVALISLRSDVASDCIVYWSGKSDFGGCVWDNIRPNTAWCLIFAFAIGRGYSYAVAKVVAEQLHKMNYRDIALFAIPG